MFRKCAGVLIAVLMLLTLAPVSTAEEVSLHEARLVGAVHVNAHVSGRPILRAMDIVTGIGIQTEGIAYSIREVRELRAPGVHRPIAFILDLNPRGFVVVSTNTNIRPIIAYSFESNFDMTEHPDNILLNMLRYDMRTRIERMEQIPETVRIQNQKLWNQYVNQDENLLSALHTAPTWGPLLTTRWSQRPFYNDSAPLDVVTGLRSPTGCVATAVAQIIRFHESPDWVNFDYDYTFTWDPRDRHGTRTMRLQGTIRRTFNYRLMPDRLTAPNQQVADLMYAVGVSVRMMFTSRASGAFSKVVPQALKENFGFQQANDVCSSVADFYTRLTGNIKASLPVYLGIRTVTRYPREGAHAVVADGWRDTGGRGKHHINFGWGDHPATAWYHLPDMFRDWDLVRMAVMDIVPNTPPPTPTPRFPAHGATGISTTPLLMTYAVTDADGHPVRYFFRVREGSRRGPIATDGWAGLAGDTIYAIGIDGDRKSLTAGTTYYWRVVTVDTTTRTMTPFNVRTFITDHIAGQNARSRDQSGWSEPRHFTTAGINIPPPTPTLHSPAHGATGISTTVTLISNAVTDADGDPVRYFFRVQNAAGTIITDGFAGVAGDTHYVVGTDGDGFSLTAGTTYNWWVIAHDGIVFGSWSTGRSFTTVANPVLSVTPASRDFGNIIIGQSHNLAFTVRNTGGGTLSGSASVTAPFSIISGSPFSLGAGLSTTVTVRFSPTATGPISRTVAFTSNAGNLNRGVSGVGGPAVDVSPQSVRGAAREAIVVPLIINDAAGIDAFGMKLTFDTTQLTFVGVSKTALTADFTMFRGELTAPGVITIGGFWADHKISAGSVVRWLMLISPLMIGCGKGILPAWP